MLSLAFDEPPEKLVEHFSLCLPHVRQVVTTKHPTHHIDCAVLAYPVARRWLLDGLREDVKDIDMLHFFIVSRQACITSLALSPSYSIVLNFSSCGKMF